MVGGYNIFDPIVVVVAVFVTIYLLIFQPQKLLLFLPLFLSMYFIIPVAGLLTLWHIVPVLVGVWWIFSGRLRIPKNTHLALLILIIFFVAQFLFALTIGDAGPRVLLRGMYYCGLFFLFVFSFAMVRRPGGLHLLVCGLAIAAAIHAVYGVYQLVAVAADLPFRGIVRGTGAGDIAFSGGILRINGLANEPKRVGYVLALGGLAFFELGRSQNERFKRAYRVFGIFVLAISFFTFSNSYLFAVALSAGCVLVLYPRVIRYAILPIGLVFAVLAVWGSIFDLWHAFETSFSSRVEEIQVGLSGRFVYRQEFYALDYIKSHPIVVLTGLGMGRYNSVLNENYGLGVGIGESGILISLNSNLLELIFDLGGVATITLYVALILVILRLRTRNMAFLMILLIFVGLQSLTLQTLQFLMLLMGAAIAQTQNSGVRLATSASPSKSTGLPKPSRVSKLGRVDNVSHPQAD